MEHRLKRVPSALIVVSLIGPLLVACSSLSKDRVVDVQSDIQLISGNLYVNDLARYSFEAPEGFSSSSDDEEGMYFGYSEESRYGRMTIQSYDGQGRRLCPPLGIQVPLTLDVDGGAAEWGRVDFWDTWGSEGGVPMDQLPVCEPLQVKDHLSLPLDTTTNVAYAFCSENHGKAVIICIQQATNDPALAEEIFLSFRWLE